MTAHTITCRGCANLNEGTQTHCFRCGLPLRRVQAPPHGNPDSPPAPIVQPGQTLDGRYKIHRQLGEGAMGQVYEATDERLNRRVALKVIAAWVLERPNARARVQREAQALGRLRHPNVIEIHNFFDHQGGLVLDLELVEGGDLEEAIPSGGLPVATACDLMRGILRGLDALHGAGLVHRDLKPANILLSEDGLPKVADLGIAHDGESADAGLTRVGARLGTPEYMAPEQILGRPLDARTDLYSAGIMLYEMLSGDVPFAGSTDFEIQEQHVSAPPDLALLRSRLPEPLLHVLAQSLAKSPDERFDSAKAMQRALANSMRHAPPPPKRPAPAPEPLSVPLAAPLAAPEGGSSQPHVDGQAPEPSASSNASRRGRYVVAAVILAVVGVLALNWWNVQREKAEAARAATQRAEKRAAVLAELEADKVAKAETLARDEAINACLTTPDKASCAKACEAGDAPSCAINACHGTAEPDACERGCKAGSGLSCSIKLCRENGEPGACERGCSAGNELSCSIKLCRDEGEPDACQRACDAGSELSCAIHLCRNKEIAIACKRACFAGVTRACGRFVVANDDGVRLLAPDGTSGRVLSTARASSPRPVGDLIYYLANLHRPDAPAELRVVGATEPDHLIARLPQSFTCSHESDDSPQTYATWSLGLDEASDFYVLPSEQVACLSLQDGPPNNMNVRVVAQISLKTGALERSVFAFNCAPENEPTPCNDNRPSAPASTEPSRNPLHVYRVENQMLLRRAPDGSSSEETDLVGFSEGRQSPSGRWVVISGNSTEGDYSHSQAFLLDRKSGQVFPIVMGPSAALPRLDAPGLDDQDTIDVVGQSTIAWASNADELIVDSLLVFPGERGLWIDGDIVALP